jgi:hypothetical protein
MGRKKIKIEDKKIRMSVTVDSKIEKLVREGYINFSSLVNKLLKDYFDDVKKM